MILDNTESNSSTINDVIAGIPRRKSSVREQSALEVGEHLLDSGYGAEFKHDFLRCDRIRSSLVAIKGELTRLNLFA